MHRRLAILTSGLVALLTTGCASWFMVGSEPVTGSPATPLATCTVAACVQVGTNAAVAGPAGQVYYLGRGLRGLELSEVETATGKGARITNTWSDETGDHFLTYVRTNQAWHYVFPKGQASGTRFVYLKGTYAVEDVGGTLRVTRGTPGFACAMQCNAAVAAAPPPPAAPAPVAPPTTAPALSAPPGPAASCAKDTDCPGEEVCEDGRCRAPGTPASATASRPAAPQPPPPVPAPPAVSPAPPLTAAPVEPPGPARKRHLGFLLGAIGGGAAAIAMVSWGAAMNGTGEDASLARDRSGFESAQTQQRVAYGLTAAFGVLGATSLVLYFVTGKLEPAPARVRLTPGPGLAGLGVRGGF